MEYHVPADHPARYPFRCAFSLATDRSPCAESPPQATEQA